MKYLSASRAAGHSAAKAQQKTVACRSHRAGVIDRGGTTGDHEIAGQSYIGLREEAVGADRVEHHEDSNQGDEPSLQPA
jgi:hypothetical protein